VSRPPDPGPHRGATGRPPPQLPLFLERAPYRRRRIMDAARLLPLFGAALLLLPMLWDRTHGTAAGAVYLFLVWLAIIAVTAFLARRLSDPLRHGAGRGREGEGEDR
jgi:hypothetical protein